LEPWIGDRYVADDAAWLDVVTGRSVALTLTPLAEATSRPHACAEASAVWEDGVRRLADYGAHGGARWFETWTGPASAAVRAYAVRHMPPRAVDLIVRHTEGPSHRGPRTIAVVAPAGAGTASVLSQAARDLRELGFVTIRADCRIAASLRAELCHRHLVIIDTPDARAAGLTAAWLVDLVRVSNRSHLVLSLSPVRPAAGPVIEIAPSSIEGLVEAFIPGSWAPAEDVIVAAARRSAGWPHRFVQALDAARAVHDRRAGLCVGVGEQPRAITSRFLRAEALARRGRPAAAGRWYRAALEAARRRHDDGAVAAAFERLAAGRAMPSEARHGAAVAGDLLRQVVSRGARLRIANAAARACLTAGELARAETLVSLVDAEAALGSQPVPGAHIALRAELRFWQGQFDLGARELAGCAGGGPAVPVWRELLAWARGSRVGDCHDLPLDLPDEDEWTPVWCAAVRVLASAERGDRESVSAAIDALDARAGRGERRALARVVAAEAWLRCGEDRRARTLLKCRGKAPRDGLWWTVETWMARAAGMPVASRDEQRMKQAITRQAVAGIRRWGQRRTSMSLLQGVSALLQIVQDADDERVALDRACTWARETAQAAAVGLFAAEGALWLSGDRQAVGAGGEASLRACLETSRPVLVHRDGLTWASAPVRCGGVTIAAAVGRGCADRVAALPETIEALAAVSAPWVRARLDTARLAHGADALAASIVGASAAIAAVREAAARAAATPFSVVIEGESGTGKELVARALHQLSPRRDRRMCTLNCAALSDELIEAELFGHTRGAFTGALAVRAGLFEDAHQGTLLLDEVTELSPRAQAKLLRVLQEGEIRRLGENAPRAVDVRVIAATNRPLSRAVGDGRFREDLLFRLAVVRIVVPPLRDRLEDVPLLAHAFWREFARRAGSRAELGADALAALCRSSWPGNVRQLQNALAALAVAAPARGRVSARHVVAVLEAQGGHVAAGDVPLDVARLRVERSVVAAALARHAGCRRTAARALGLSRQGLTKAIRRLGLHERPDAAGVA
jgi:DNA-binding NtrC family response regulator